MTRDEVDALIIRAMREGCTPERDVMAAVFFAGMEKAADIADGLWWPNRICDAVALIRKEAASE